VCCFTAAGIEITGGDYDCITLLHSELWGKRPKMVETAIFSKLSYL
jgi:hypothetical protein